MSYENDIVIRQQIYLEGVKNDEAQNGELVRDAIIAIVITLLLRRGVNSLSELSKREFSALVSEVTAKLKERFNSLSVATTKRLITIMKADYAVTKFVYRKMFPGLAPPPKITAAKLWVDIRNDPVAATGDKPLEMIKGYYDSAVSSVVQTLKVAYANKLTVAATVLLYQGTKANKYKDALLTKLFRQYGAVTETVIQHVSTVIGSTLGSFFSPRYIWLSVLDGNTTDICRGRNGHVYFYGKGPLPPAHYRCRSRTRPVFQEATVPASFYQWWMAQPNNFQDDVFGSRIAGQFRSGSLKAVDLPKYENKLRLTPAEYLAKQNLITTS